MNFLAHLHCSPNQELVRVFNFTGDGFRGNHWKSHATDVMIIGVEIPTQTIILYLKLRNNQFGPKRERQLL